MNELLNTIIDAVNQGISIDFCSFNSFSLMIRVRRKDCYAIHSINFNELNMFENPDELVVMVIKHVISMVKKDENDPLR